VHRLCLRTALTNDTDSSLKPLLHTWSLSVEEQFYFIWPAMLASLYYFKKQRFIPITVILLGVFSLALNILIFADNLTVQAWFSEQSGKSEFDINSTAFYWLPFRVFEFSIGAILVWLGSARKQLLAEILFLLGLLIIVGSLVLLNSKMNFPSTAALWPCLGAALMIFSGPNHRLSRRVSNGPLVGLGLISYSLYLIHWPLIVFYKYWSGRDFSDFELIGIFFVSIAAAYLMYRFIEQPFRKQASHSSRAGQRSNRPFFSGTLLVTLIAIGVSLSAITSKGWLSRYPADMVAQLTYKAGDYRDFFWANMKRLESGFNNNSRPKVLLIGDSMAADLANVLVAAEQHENLDLATILVGENCKTLFGLNAKQYRSIYAGANNKCKREHSRVLAKNELISSADTIVLASYLWEENFARMISLSVDHLKNLTSANILVLGLKNQISNGIQFQNKHAFSPNAHTLRTPPHPKVDIINQLLKDSAKDYTYFDLLDLFCDEQGCQRITKEGYAIIFDGSHLSENGAEFLANGVKESAWLKSLLEHKL